MDLETDQEIRLGTLHAVLDVARPSVFTRNREWETLACWGDWGIFVGACVNFHC